MCDRKIWEMKTNGSDEKKKDRKWVQRKSERKGKERQKKKKEQKIRERETSKWKVNKRETEYGDVCVYVCVSERGRDIKVK